ncbi:hypothetical protein [Kitasatospora viridis]|uniref:Uncharacterized protein n=1 Tax=Kitasatospora viridis TaxID=281105 RepID=A0A561SA09_9ACTN|nr:hypothetical protein [Kitasatospora viridis]TWF71712.1 hypothetical protein FHX73_1883 [Kitasatospora viridis]
MTTTAPLRATRGQLAVYREVHRAFYINQEQPSEAVTFTPALVTSVRRDGTVKAMRGPDGRTFATAAVLPKDHKILLVESGRCATDAVLKAAAARTWGGSSLFKAYDTLDEVKALLAEHPAPEQPAAKPPRPAAPATLVVARRKPSNHSPMAWTVALPTADATPGVIVAMDCRTKTRAMIIAGWLEDTGFDWTADRSEISNNPAVLALYSAITHDLNEARNGYGVWPEEQPEKYTELLAALRR